MSQEKQKFTSSIPTEPLKRLESVIALGKKLVAELDLERSVDTLSRWMAHYIAELMSAAEETNDPEERSKAQEKCCETILKLWEHRASLPHGAGPLANLENVLKAIESLQGEGMPRWSGFSPGEIKKLGGPWVQFAKVVEEAGLQMCRIAVLTAIAETAFGKEKRWLQEHGEMLSEEETKIIKALDSWLSEKISWQTKKDQVSIGDLEPDERTRRVIEEIEASIMRLKSSFESLLNKVQQ